MTDNSNRTTQGGSEYDRLSNAVSFILTREVNILSSSDVGRSGNENLQDAFLGLLTLFKPSVFCDVGANDGSISMAVRKALPECRVFAFEANPEIHKNNERDLVANGICYDNIAISDSVGVTKIHVPRTLSRKYVNGELIPDKIIENRQTGKASLLLRNESATYESFDVRTETLDNLFPRNGLKDKETFFLWIDVEGISEKVLIGACNLLRDTTAVFVECENFAFWRDGSSAAGVTDLLIREGFVPVARDREYDDKQFNMLFVAGRVANLLSPHLFDQASDLRTCLRPSTGSAALARKPLSANASKLSAFFTAKRRQIGAALSAGRLLPSATVQPLHSAHSSEARTVVPTNLPRLNLLDAPSERSTFSSVASFLQADVPVFVPCFNNPTYSASMVSQLRNWGFRRIILIDGGSSYPPMREFLTSVTGVATVISRPDNPGARHIFLDSAELSLLPRHFCVTDPDLSFNSEMPSNFLGELAALTERERIGKAGLALDLSDSELMRKETFVIGTRRWTIPEWERRHWKVKLPPVRAGGNPVYRASIDTTFALCDKNYLNPAKHLQAVRVAGTFTCRHLPWYIENGLPPEEEEFYRSTANSSYYLGGGGPNGSLVP